MVSKAANNYISLSGNYEKLLKIIHRPCCEHLHVGTTFFLPNHSRQKYQRAEEIVHFLTEERLVSVIAWGANIDDVILSFQIYIFFVVVALSTTNLSSSVILRYIQHDLLTI